MTLPFDETRMRSALQKAWSLKTARQWTAECPAAGQCNVTAVVVQDIYGGDICLTPLDGYDVPHFYNVFDGQRVDLTDSQFDVSPSYDDTPTTRAHAMNWVTSEEHETLLSALKTELERNRTNLRQT